MLLGILASSHLLMAGEVVVSGYAGGNSSDMIYVYTWTDPVTWRESQIAILKPGEDGRFSLTIDNAGVKEYVIRNGVHDNHFFIDGLNPLDLVLVPYRPLTQADKENPFFSYTSVLAASTNEGDLNNLIRRFENRYLEASGMITTIFIEGGKSTERESVLKLLEDSLDTANIPFLDSWVKYRIAGLKLSGINDPDMRKKVLLELEDSFDEGNRSCNSFIEEHFAHFLRDMASGQGGSAVRETLERGGTAAPLAELAASVTGITEKHLLEYIVIMNLYFEYYSNYFNKEDVFRLLSWMGSNAVTIQGRLLAETLSEKLGRFVAGAPLPGFNLAGPDGDLYSPASWDGKFILLSFGRSDSYSTISEYNLLVRWQVQYGDYLEIVTILCDDDYETGVLKMSDNGFKWLMLDGSGRNELSSLYEVRFFPAFFLADHTGRIIRAPAPFPSENLMQVLQEKLQPYLLDDIRKR